ncbi:MAG: hypothetical protein L0I76_23750 [Pseudonocardia sp.]|nr:hypothetical protein [Pseudonocardia sp.]
MDEFMALFNSVEVQAWRLLVHDEYNATEAEGARRREWGRTGTVPDRSGDDWLAMVRRYAEADVAFARVHVFPGRDELTPYCEYVLDSYEWNDAAGERVAIADRALHPELDRLDRDFWVLDDSVVVLVYGPDGEFSGAYLAEGHEREDRLEHRRIAEECSVRLAEYKDARSRRLTA